MSSSDNSSTSSTTSTRVLWLATALIALGAVNEVSGRIRSVPLGRFDALVSLANSAVHSAVYSLAVGVLLTRASIPKENIAFLCRKSSLMLLLTVGLLDSAGPTMGFVAQPYVPEWHVVAPRWKAGRERGKKGGCRGPLSCSSTTTQSSVEGSNLTWMAALVALSTAPTALSFALKELLLRSYEKEQQLDAREDGSRLLPLLEHRQHSAHSSQEQTHSPERINTADACSLLVLCADSPQRVSHQGSACVCLFRIPLTRSPSQGVPQGEPSCATPFADSACLPRVGMRPSISMPHTALCDLQEPGESISNFLWDAFRCFCGNSSYSPPGSPLAPPQCRYAAVAYGAYATANLFFNISVLAVVLEGSSLLSFMAMKAILPVSLLLYAANKWPLLPETDSHLSSPILLSLFLVLTGVISFHFESLRCTYAYRDSNPPCCWPLSLRR
ncbi:transmembrane protein [Cyclospora cayetanensis]|uniref:Transmembrane protein n=1 Tax=Cyclospora cayetanensis TaxID=88456 RepID=A0A1D3D9W3_9EIME|nr:transmembrane protein [Cyclospora cayetanensis]